MKAKQFNYKKAKKLIEEQGRLKKWVAEQIGITQGTFTQYINGHTKPGGETIKKLADLLGVSVDELLSK